MVQEIYQQILMPIACTIGDADLPHCSLPVRAMGFPRVIVGGRPWSCLGDLNIPHLLPTGIGCVPHVAPIAVGSVKTIVGGRPGGFVGSPLIACTAVATGFPRVFCSV